MPLYQSEGADGFFVIRQIPGWALWLSRFLRRINFDRWLTWLPGVSRLKNEPDTLVVNKRVAFILRNQLFHLLGYRRKQDSGLICLFDSICQGLGTAAAAPTVIQNRNLHLGCILDCLNGSCGAAGAASTEKF